MRQIHDNMDEMINSLLSYVKSYIETPCEPRPSRKNFFPIENPVQAYSTIYTMINDKKTEQDTIETMYQEEMECVVDFCRSLKFVSITKLNRQHDGFRLLITWLGCFLHHLNLFYLRIVGSNESMESVFMSHFCNEFIYPNLSHITEELLKIWRAIRLHSASETDRHDARYLVESFEKIRPEFYDIWESAYLEECHCYYTRLMVEKGEDMDYETMLQVLEQEEVLCHQCMSQANTWSPLVDIYKTVVIQPCFSRILNDPDFGWKSMLRRSSESKSIVRLAQLLSLCENRRPEWLACYSSYLKEELRGETMTISRMLDILFAQETMLNETGISREFEKVLRYEFCTVIDTRMLNKVVKALDFHLRRREHRAILRVIRLFQLCNDTDGFMILYREMFKRRIMDVDVDLSLEQRVLDIMEVRMGIAYVMTISNLLKNIRERLSMDNVSLAIVSKIAWNEYIAHAPQIRTPPMIHERLSMLHSVYRENTITQEKVMLDASYDHGCVILQAWLNPRDQSGYELIMTPIQAIALFAVHERCEETLKHMRKEVFQSLSREKTNILLATGEEWKVHNEFTSSSRRIRMPSISYSSQGQQDGNGQEDGSQSSQDGNRHGDHSASLDAFIVRTLKHRSPETIDHADLLQLCSQLHQHPSKIFIKQRIGSLLEREYIVRKNLSAYQYSP